MRNANNISLYNRNEAQLRIIDGESSAVRRDSDRSPPYLSLVWKQGGILSSKKPKTVIDKQPVIRQDLPPIRDSGRWKWLKEHAEVLSLIVVLLSIIVGGAWYLSKYDSRLGELEKVVDGPNGLSRINEVVTEVSKRLAAVEGTLKTVNQLLPYVLSQIFKPQATALGFKDPQIVPVQLSEPFATTLPVIQVKSTFSNGTAFQLEFKVEAVTQDSIKFLVNGVSEGHPFLNVGVTLPHQVGVPVELNKAVFIPGMPKILLTILDFPTAETAIVAVGESAHS